MENHSDMSEVLEDIRNIIYYYVKKEYKKNLKEKNIKLMSTNEIESFTKKLLEISRDEIESFIYENLQKIMEDRTPKRENIISLINDIMNDKDLITENIISEIEIYQKNKKSKKKSNKILI